MDRAAYLSTWIVSMPARSLKNQPQDVYMSEGVALRVEEHPGLVVVPDDVAACELVPRQRADQQPEVVVARRPRISRAARPRRSNTSVPQSRSTSRARRADRATPGSSPRARRCGSRSRPSTAGHRGRTTRRWCARRTSVVGGDSPAGRPGSAPARRRRARRSPTPEPRSRRHRRDGGRTSRRRWRRP